MPVGAATWHLAAHGRGLRDDHEKPGEEIRDAGFRSVDRARRSPPLPAGGGRSIVGDCSRLPCSEIHDDERAATVTAFTERALDFFLDRVVVAERLMIDNAFAYTQNRSRRELLHARAIRRIRTRPYTPRTDGKVER